MGVKLYDHQKEALSKMKNGCILCGGVGSGKSRTSLAYYYISQGLDYENPNPNRDFIHIPPKDLYIITTARKRDTLEWEDELVPFLMTTTDSNPYCNKVIVDSWNNISKYVEIKDAFFIFDEQRVVGKGTWAKSFVKITRSNEWILLSATPGDTWSDYIPVFIANGFYRNRTEFIHEHAVWNRYSKFPQIDHYMGTGKLIKYRNDILVNMPYKKPTTPHHETIYVEYDMKLYKDIMKNRWNYRTEEPIVNASELCYELRRVSNIHSSRLSEVERIVHERRKVIIFYNFDYELELLRQLAKDKGWTQAEWNGHRHQKIPEGDIWVYLVQYTAGAEGWNCTDTDTIIFFSQNYSYKIMIQSSGRIDRMNTPFENLYFYHLKSHSGIDLAISQALKNKKKFNESAFAEKTLA